MSIDQAQMPRDDQDSTSSGLGWGRIALSLALVIAAIVFAMWVTDKGVFAGPNHSLTDNVKDGSMNAQFNGLDGDDVCFYLWDPDTGEIRHHDSCAKKNEFLNLDQEFRDGPVVLPKFTLDGRGGGYSVALVRVGAVAGLALGEPIPGSVSESPVSAGVTVEPVTPAGK